VKKDIQLLELHLQNFKGIKNLSIKFNKVHNIFGDNGTGKTTIKDGYFWLFFDKDSTDRKQFEIKTLDKNNNPLHGLEHSVTGILSVNGKKKIFQKTYKEKWTKKRGESEELLTGHETIYYVNDVPCTQTDYKKEVSAIFDENLFKLISDPLYFSQGIKWQERRNVLMQMNGNITTDMVIDSDKELEPLRELLEDTDIDSLRKSLSSKKKRLNDDIKALPVRIDECYKSIVEYDFDTVKTTLKQKQVRLENIENQITSNTEVDSKRQAKVNRLSEVRRLMDNIELAAKQDASKLLNNAKNALQELNNRLNNLEIKHQGQTRLITRLNSEREDLDKHCSQLREQWHTENAKELTFDEHQFVCPTCQRLLDANDVENKKDEMLKNFNQDKAKKLEGINNKGVSAKNRIKEIDESVESIQKEVEILESEMSVLNDEIEKGEKELQDYQIDDTAITYSADYYTLKGERVAIEEELERPVDYKAKLSELSSEKRSIQKEIDELKLQLNQESINQKQKERVEQLKNEERDLADKIAEIEGKEFLCEKFIRAKVDLLEGEINSKFKYVSFKLFNTQINQGIEETCEPLIKGVPFLDANHAAQINAGLDIINTLSEHYQVSGPVFIDNAESINELLPFSGQLVRLVVTKDKSLKIN
jgi:exonuclease SbcC